MMGTKRLGTLSAVAISAIAVEAAAADIAINAQGRLYSVAVTSYRDMPFRTVVRQQYDCSCGSAAVATLLRFHFARDVGEAEVFKAMYAHGDQEKIRKVGFSLLDLKRYIESQGLKADGFRISLEQLERSSAPVITVITVNNYRHFVVVKGAQNGEILVGDPALGLRKYSRNAFAKVWNGVVLAVRGPSSPRYNRADEWRSWPLPPYALATTHTPIAALTRELPPLYQITPSLPPFVLPR